MPDDVKQVRNDTLKLDLHPFEIKTLKLQLQPAKKGS